jgi:hypothetical protein
VIARILLILVLIPLLLSQSWSFNLATDRSELSIAVPNTAASLIAPIDIDDEHRHAPASTCFCIEISSSLASPSRTDSAIDKAPSAPAARPLYKKNSVFLI